MSGPANVVLEDDIAIAATYGTALLGIAAQAIRHGLDCGEQITLDAKSYPAPLQLLRATFVTLEHADELRGCVGAIEPHQALASSVAHHAHCAAFHDDRFAPVDAAAWRDLTASISILSPREPLPASDEAGARAALRPGIDGLVFSADGRRAVFLPKVWDELPEPARFLNLLKRKAGFAESYWSDRVRLERFIAVSVPSASLASFC